MLHAQSALYLPFSRNAMLGAGMLALIGWASLTATTHAQSSSCPGAPGTATTYTFEDIPSSRDDMLPSVHRSLSMLGRLASLGNCAVKITCVARSASRANIRSRDRRCSATLGALVRYETRSAVRSRIAGEIELIKIDAGTPGYSASTTYVSLVAR